MKKLSYGCDAGSVAVNCGGSIIYFPNNYGDCDSTIYIMDQDEFEEYFKTHQQYFKKPYDVMEFKQACDFKNAIVLTYDCPHGSDEYDSDVILNGYYFVYAWSGKVYFVRHGECR